MRIWTFEKSLLSSVAIHKIRLTVSGIFCERQHPGYSIRFRGQEYQDIITNTLEKLHSHQ